MYRRRRKRWWMKWSGLLSAQCSPQDCCRSAPSPVATWDRPPPRGGSGEKEKKYFRLLQVESDSYHFKLINFHCLLSLLVTCGGKILGVKYMKSTQGEILPNPVVCITPLNMIVREDTKHLPVTKTSIGTIERKKMTRHCKWGKI